MHEFKRPPRRIGISLGNIDRFDHGLGEFARQLGHRFAAAAPAWHDKHGIAIDFHLKPALAGVFGNSVGYRDVTRWQTWRHRTEVPYALWHSLHQLNKARPPHGCTTRLVTVHDLNYLYHPRALSRWRHDRRTRAVLGRFDHMVAISQHTAEDVRRHLAWQKPLEVIYNGATDLSASPREALPGRSPEKPFLFHLSRLSPSKNPGALIELARTWPEMDFVLCGPVNRNSQALSEAQHPANVSFHLGISEAQKAWAFAHCAGFVFPSLTEGFGLPPVEAMYFGKPVFLARRTALPEVGGAAAYYLDSFEPQDMRRVIEQGLRSAAMPGHDQAVRAQAARFNWDRCAQEYLGLYARLLGLPQDQIISECASSAASVTPTSPQPVL